MNNCIYCSATLSDKGVFCPQCAKQSKCKNCGDLLEIDAKACVVCGTLIGKGNSSSPIQNNYIFANTFELNETAEFDGGKNSRNIKLVCSNEAVSNFGEFVERRIRGNQPIGEVRTPRDISSNFQDALPPNNESESFEDYSQTSKATKDFQDEKPLNNHSSEIEILHKIFRKDGSVWKLDEIQLNSSSKLDYARRLTFLFLYLNELEGNSKTPRTNLNSILEDSTVYDGNTRTWLANEPAISKDDDKLELNAAGRRQAQESIKNLSENLVAEPWLPGKITKRNSKTSSSGKDSKDVTKRSVGKKNPKTSTIIEKWKSLDQKFDGHKIFSEKTVFDKGLLGLWAIRKATKDEVKVVSSGQIAKFLFDVFELKVHRRSLENALGNKDAKDKVSKESATSFQILPPGSEYVEKMIAA